MVFQHVLVALCWIFYCVLHTVLASVRTKRRVQKIVGERYRYYRLFYTVFAALTLAAIVLYQFSVSSARLFQTSLPTTIFGRLLAAAGLSLMIVCIKKYFVSLSGLKSLFQERPQAVLMITGIHRFVRHPLYTGTFLAIWGFWVLFPTVSLLITDSVITAYTLLAIPLEEEKLIAEFGESYRSYRQNVPKLFPRF